MLSDNCIHCGKCTKHCAFLSKYGLDLKSFSQRKDLAYHCFLCGECSAACPLGIDGRAIALAMRRERTAAKGGRPDEKGYGLLLAEKQNYIFRSKLKGNRRSVLFPGCNFPSFYPETTQHLMELLAEKADMGVLFDCCGKPIDELGMDDGAVALGKRLKEAGVEELVVLCPNCYYHLKDKLGIAVVSIYDKLQSLGLGKVIEEEQLTLFTPCPDKKSRELEASLTPYLPADHSRVEGVSCCGLGGCAAGKEPELAKAFALELKQREHANVYTYCASCAGTFSRSGVNHVHHVLVEILETEETPELSLKSVWNRAKYKFTK